MEVELIDISENIKRIRQLIDQVVDTDLNIVVCGETGVGKEVVVRSLYAKTYPPKKSNNNKMKKSKRIYCAYYRFSIGACANYDGYFSKVENR